jgi:aerobic-type carbon monoxide dehydrogenase small subunit (CoxS/CutS family)
MAMKTTISFRLNGRAVRLTVDGDRMLLWVLRTELGLTGTKYACGEGFCGACTVLVNGEAVLSCQYPVKNVEGRDVLTIEGLAQGDVLHPLQEAFIKTNAMQCGFCTPGMVMNALALLRRNSSPTRAEILAAMEGNVCRCGGYVRVVQAIEDAAKAMKGAAGR